MPAAGTEALEAFIRARLAARMATAEGDGDPGPVAGGLLPDGLVRAMCDMFGASALLLAPGRPGAGLGPGALS